MGELTTAVAGIGKEPVAGGDGPTGADAKYEPEYEEMASQVARLGSVSGEAVDWRKVVTLATTLLTAKSKDVTVAAYLCAGLFDVEGYGGLAAGLEVLADLHETFTDTLFPSRPRGRSNALEWLKERLEAAVEKQPARGGEGEAVAAAAAQAGRLDGLARDQYGDAAPALGPVRRALDRMAQEAAKAAEEEAAPPPAAAAAAPTSAGVGPMGTPDEVLKALAAAGPLFAAADPTHPLAYRLPRLAAWAKLTQLPPNQGGKTQIPAPQGPTRKALEGLLAAADWQQLVTGCGARLATEPLWLDPQRWVVQGLRGLGPGYAAAADGVIGELRLFVTRLAGVERLTFGDGTPLADGETRMWLESEVLATGGEAPASGAGEAAPWEEGAHEARKLATGGDLKGAVALLQTGARGASGGRERFFWRLATARLCQGAARGDIALPLLEDLDRESVARDLAGWEPSLALDALAGLLAARKGSGGRPTPEQVQRLEELRQRLCQLDPVAALDLDGVK